MPDQKLITAVKAEIEQHRNALTQVHEGTKDASITPDAEVTVTRILNGCRLILDMAMNKVWSAHNNKKPDKKKPNVYFPCCHSQDDLDGRLQCAQLSNLSTANPDCYAAILRCQPFPDNENNWWHELFILTGTKHERYVEIDSERSADIGIGAGQNLYIKSFSIPKNRMMIDSDAVNAATGEPEKLRIDFIEHFNSVLRETGKNPVEFCQQCIDNAEEVFRELIETLP